MDKEKKEIHPDDALRQIQALCDQLGYSLGVVVIGPRTGSAANPLDFLPEGWQVRVIVVKEK